MRPKRWTPQEVPHEKIDTIIEAIRMTPTSSGAPSLLIAEPRRDPDVDNELWLQ